MQNYPGGKELTWLFGKDDIILDYIIYSNALANATRRLIG